ncbi:hypothetical protein [Streptomyces sp. NPDC029554]|uniref:hypothetical protein n=1 Tax=Streptomyces sp. NPDC029554 TaxID=3155126 RepID=UPI0033F7BC9C
MTANEPTPARAPGDRNRDRQARNGRGHYQGDIYADEKAAAAARYYAEHPGITYQQLAEATGYTNRGDAWRAVQKARKAALQQAGAELIATEAAQLDDLFVHAMEILERDHVMVSHGRVVKDDTGAPILDDGPKLAAVREMRQIRESYRKLFGLDAPSRVSVDAEKLGQEITKLLDAATEPEDASDDPDA